MAIAAAAWFVAAVAGLHALRPDVSPLASVTSEYAVGPYGALMTTAYLAISLALVTLGLGLARHLATPPWRVAGIVLLFLGALGATVAALFPVDIGVAVPVTATGRAHRVAAITAFASMTLGPLLLALRLRGDPGWRHVARLGAAVGAVGLPAFAAIQLFLLERGLGGAAQRVVLALVVVWIVAAALRLTAAPSTDPRTS